MNTRRLLQNDVFVAAVPEHIDPGNPEQRSQLLAELDMVARRYVHQQWAGQRRRPMDVEHAQSEWLITCKREQIDGFQPAHDCAACRAGHDQADAFLRENPGRWVAMANLTYTEVWPAH